MEGNPFIAIPEGALIMTGSITAPLRFKTTKESGGIQYRGDEYPVWVDLADRENAVNKFVVVVGKSALRLRSWPESTGEWKLANPGVTWRTNSVHWPYNRKTGYNDPGEACQAHILSEVELIVQRQWGVDAMRDMIKKMIKYAELRSLARNAASFHKRFKEREADAMAAHETWLEHKAKLDAEMEKFGKIAQLFGGLEMAWPNVVD